MGTFVFQDIVASEYGRDVFLDHNVPVFLYDEYVHAERFFCQGMLRFKFEDIFVVFQLFLDGLVEGRMPGDSFSDQASPLSKLIVAHKLGRRGAQFLLDLANLIQGKFQPFRYILRCLPV
jgi:hypothetical protein